MRAFLLFVIMIILFTISNKLSRLIEIEEAKIELSSNPLQLN